MDLLPAILLAVSLTAAIFGIPWLIVFAPDYFTDRKKAKLSRTPERELLVEMILELTLAPDEWEHVAAQCYMHKPTEIRVHALTYTTYIEGPELKIQLHSMEFGHSQIKQEMDKVAKAVIERAKQNADLEALKVMTKAYQTWGRMQ